MKKNKSMLACILALLLIFVNGNVGQNVSAQDPNDVSARMEISAYNMKLVKTPVQDIIVNGIKADPTPEIRVGDTIAFDVNWGIKDTETPTKIMEGNYIEIALPVGFNFYSQIENNSGIGTPSIVERDGKHFFRFTFNKTIEDVKEVKNGWYRNIKGGVKEGLENVEVGFIGEPIQLKILPKKVVAFGSEVWGIWKERKLPFLKEGVSIYASDTIEWNMWANFRALQQDMEESKIDSEYQLDDLVIVDYLPEGFDIAPEDPTAPIPADQANKTLILAMATAYAPTPENPHMLSNSFAIGMPIRLSLENAIRSNGTETLEEFIKRVNDTNNEKPEEAPGAGKRTLGVYTHKTTFKEKTLVGGNPVEVEYEATQHVIVVAFGSVAKAGGATYDGVYAMLAKYNDSIQHKELSTAIEHHDEANAEQKAVMQKTYSGGKPIHAWRLLVNTKFPEEKKNTYTNNAEMRSGKDQIKIVSDIRHTQYVKAEAGADGDLVLAVVPVKKTWDDVNDVPAGTKVVVELLADGVPTGKTLELTSEGGWEGMFTSLEKYKAVQVGAKTKYERIAYSVVEKPLHGYVSMPSSLTNGVYEIRNTKNPDAWANVRITKKWENVEPKEYENLTVTAVIEKTVGGVKEVVKTIELNQKNNWQASTKLLKTNEYGENIEYSVKEINPIAGFITSVAGNTENGFVITNTKTPTVNVKVTKTWEGDAPAGLLSITVNIKIGNRIEDTLELSVNNNWTAEKTMVKNDTNGNAIAYTIEEAVINGYTPEYGGDLANGFTIHNKKSNNHPPTTTTAPQTTAPQPVTTTVTSTQKDTAPEYFPPVTTTLGTANIDEDDPARGGVTTTSVNTQEGEGSTQSSDSNVAGTGDKLPNTGNLPNELFYILGAFVATLGVLVLTLQKLKK